jgi:hypothetical protein
MEQKPWNVNSHTTDQEINHILETENPFPYTQEYANWPCDELIKIVLEFQ